MWEKNSVSLKQNGGTKVLKEKLGLPKNYRITKKKIGLPKVLSFFLQISHLVDAGSNFKVQYCNTFGKVRPQSLKINI